MTFLSCKHHVNQSLRLHTPFSEIEHQIDHTALCDDEKAALWLYAWSVAHDSQSSEVLPGGANGDVQPAARRRT
jgi:hypothetical protein